jgi:betaine-homocysteine S-methyltransferase
MENKKGILERLKHDVVLGAEGYLFELERRGYVKAGPFVPEVVLDFPDAVKELHREFLHAGAEVMVAFTYYAHREKMRSVGREHDLENLNKTAIRLAREVSLEGDVLVAGNLSETWKYDHRKPEKSEKIVRPMFEEQVQWALDSGVDFIIAETFDHVGEALIALETIREAGLPAMITYTPYYEHSLDGHLWNEACKILADNGADIVGLNCSRGPATVYDLIDRIRKTVGCFVAAQPVPYRTSEPSPVFQQLQEEGQTCAFPLTLDPFLHTRFEMGAFAVKAREMGVNYIGICCGGAPHHIRSMAEALGRVVPASKYSRDLEKYPLSDSCKSYWDFET